jgi:hypothetical protein
VPVGAAPREAAVGVLDHATAEGLAGAWLLSSFERKDHSMKRARLHRCRGDPPKRMRDPIPVPQVLSFLAPLHPLPCATSLIDGSSMGEVKHFRPPLMGDAAAPGSQSGESGWWCDPPTEKQGALVMERTRAAAKMPYCPLAFQPSRNVAKSGVVSALLPSRLAAYENRRPRARLSSGH